MADRLTDFNIRSRNRPQLLAHLCHQFTARTVFQFKRSLYLRHIHAQRMLIQLGTPRFAGHRLYFRNRHQQLFRTLPHFITLFQWNTRQRTDINSKRTLIEGRKETASQRKENTQRHKEQTAQCHPLVCQHPSQRLPVNTFHPTRYKRFFQFLICLVASQQIRTKHRSQRQRNHCRSKQRHDKSNP